MSGIPRPSDLTFAEQWRRSQDDASRAQQDVSRRKADAVNDPNAADDAPPARCPACRSQDVKTTSKTVSAETYWRCCTCGEVWNVGRHRAGSRYAREPFRR